MVTALYPGSFDPVTNGHLDIAFRAAAIFDRLVVGVFDTPPKNVLFTTEQRVEMFARSVTSRSNVEVRAYKGLTVECARSVGATVLVRGLRVMTDFELELQMAVLNNRLGPEIETVCLMTSAENSFLSSSIVKDIFRLHGCLDQLVPPQVKEALTKAYEDNPETWAVPRYLAG